MKIDRFCLSCGQSTLDTPCPYCGGGVSDGIVPFSVEAPPNADGMSCAYVWNKAMEDIETKLRKLI